MAIRSNKPCAIAGCPALTSERWCNRHKANKHISRPYDQQRGTSSERGYDSEWRKLRLVALKRDNYLCLECLKSDRPTQAKEVHHIIGIDINPNLRLDLDNLASVCKPCHLKLTEQEQGIWGRKATKKV
jgi:5-methylcytosine-specific restriction enzyme A